MEVLIIEDDAGLTKLVKKIVKECGFQADSVNSGAEAKQYLTVYTPYFMILDYSLTDMTGKELILELQSSEQTIPPFIVATGQGDEHIAVEMMKLGARDYLLKNIYFLDKLPEVLKRIVKEIENDDKRKQAEKALQESESKFRTIVKNTEQILFMIDKDGIFTLSEGRGLSALGLESGQIVGLSAYDTYKNYPEIIKGIKIALSGEKYVDKICIGDVHFDVWFSPNSNDNGEIIGLIGMAVNITEQKEAEKSRRQSEEKFRTIFETDNLVKLLIDSKNGNIVDANKAASNYYGWSNDELKNMNISQINTLSSEKLKLKIDKAVTDSKRHFYFKHSLANGKIRDVEVYSSIINVPGRSYIHAIIHDITERKKTEQELQKRSLAIDQSPVSIVITNVDGDIEYVNPKFCEVTGYSSEEVIGQNPRMLKSSEKPKEEYAELWNTILSENTWRGEFHNKKKDGSLYWESASISPIYDEKGKVTHFVAVKEDITEKKKMINELVVSKEKAENANKMKSIFLAQMSHEIRTPISALVSMSSLLRYDFEESADEDQLMSFDVIDRAGGRIIRTVDLLLNLSEIQAGTYEVAATKFDIMSDVLSILLSEYKKLAAKKNVSIKLNNNGVDAELIADFYTVNQIFTQLIDNAIKYTEEGEITIKTLRNESDQLIVEITDTGIGIEEAYLQNIFEPFSQEEMGYTRKYEGNGIGMTLVNKYCELNNAKLEIESTKGVGSTFRIIFN